jgi:hypothetical protein
MERGKHPSYASQRMPVMQMMAKVSAFTGQRKDDQNARIRDFSATTGDIKVIKHIRALWTIAVL